MSRPTKASAAPAAAKSGDSVFDLLSNGADSQLDTAAKLTALNLWIETARSMTDAVSYVAGHDKAFADRLRKADIPYNGALWDDYLSEGLVALHYVIGQQIDSAREAVQAAMTKDHQGKAS